MRILYFITLLLWVSTVAIAQDEGLTTDEVEVVTQTDVFGQTVQVAQGQLINESDTAFTQISLLAEVYDEDDELIGEGFGYIVNECGTALLEYALQPEASHGFSVQLELFGSDAEIDRVEVFAQGIEAEPQDAESPESMDGVTQASDQEVVLVEWIDAEFLRYGVGCRGDIFTELTWYEYDTVEDSSTPIEHPRMEIITNAMLLQTGLDEPGYLDHSMLSFAPNSRRMVYQLDLNELITAEEDGSFKRVVTALNYNRTLQGFNWIGDDKFVASYYGAYGDPVYYLVASLDGQHIGRTITDNPPSVTLPGGSRDGVRVIISGTIDDTTGYFWSSTIQNDNQLLFEADELPGNNWPAPLFIRRVEGDAYIYVARPVDGEPMLQCYDMQSEALEDLTPIPLQLATDERGGMWLSPDGRQIALAANGFNSGLWVIELTEFEACL